jgi:hypothetical protein
MMGAQTPASSPAWFPSWGAGVIVREGGRSSIPETSRLEPRSPRVLDAPPARGMTMEKDAHPRSRDGLRPSFAIITLHQNQRAQGMPGAGCTQGHRAKKLRKCALTNRFSQDNPAFPAQWFTAYIALSSVNQRLPPSSSQDLWSLAKTWRLQGRARTTRLRRPRLHCSSVRASTSTAFRSTFVTTRTPLDRNGTMRPYN